MSRYLLYQPDGRPFLAFPRGSGKRALTMFPATTWKKKFVRYYLLAADTARVPLPAISYHENVSIFTTTFQVISHFVETQVQFSNKPLLVMWNREYKRDRAYLWLGDEQIFNNMAFAKIGNVDINEMDFIKEYDALTALSNLEITFKVPLPLALTAEGHTAILLTSALPCTKTQLSFLPWSVIDTHLSPVTLASQKNVNYSQLETLEWFNYFLTSIDEESCRTLKSCLQKDSIDIGFIHGDMGSENTFIIDGQLWIVDWEKSSPLGPIASDPVAHWLGKSSATVGLNMKLIDAFIRAFIDNKIYKSNNILLALCYLKLMNFPPANFVFCHFEKQKFTFF